MSSKTSDTRYHILGLKQIKKNNTQDVIQEKSSLIDSVVLNLKIILQEKRASSAQLIELISSIQNKMNKCGGEIHLPEYIVNCPNYEMVLKHIQILCTHRNSYFFHKKFNFTNFFAGNSEIIDKSILIKQNFTNSAIKLMEQIVIVETEIEKTATREQNDSELFVKLKAALKIEESKSYLSYDYEFINFMITHYGERIHQKFSNETHPNQIEFMEFINFYTSIFKKIKAEEIVRNSYVHSEISDLFKNIIYFVHKFYSKSKHASELIILIFNYFSLLKHPEIKYDQELLSFILKNYKDFHNKFYF